MGSPTDDWPIVIQEEDEPYSYYGASSDGDDGLHFVNGYWISSFAGDSANRPIIVSEDIGGDWDEGLGSLGGGFLESVAFGDGSYLATDGYYLFSTNDPTGVWAQESGYSALGKLPRFVVYDDEWAVLTSDMKIYTASGTAGPWSMAADLLPSGATGGYSKGLVFADGKWIAAVRPSGGSFSPFEIFLWSADSIGGTWTPHGVPAGPGDLYGGLGHDGDQFFIADFDGIWRSTSLDGTWTQDLVYNDLYPEASYPYHPYAYLVRYAGGNYVITGRTNSFDLFIASGSSIDDLTVVKGAASGQSSRANGLAFNGEDWMIVGNIDPNSTGVYYATAWSTGEAVSAGGTGWGLLL